MALNEVEGIKEAFIHFMGGAVGGTAGTALTCPLEVIKTRMQSSQGFSEYQQLRQVAKTSAPLISKFAAAIPGPSSSTSNLNPALRIITFTKRWARPHWPPLSVLALRSVWKEGGTSALFKGLVPNLFGVTPSKAIYFCTYSFTKRVTNDYCAKTGSAVSHSWWPPSPNSGYVHMFSAGLAGLTAATAINPIWVVKTRLQLHHGHLGVWECFYRIVEREGILRLWRGVTGSYLGIIETMIQFVLYENLRSKISDPDTKWLGSYAGKQHQTFLQFMLAGGIAKTFAVIIAYPHEVIRTRLREEGNKLRLRQIVWSLLRNEPLTFYRGLSVQLLRSAPNTAITMLTYEVIVHMLHHFWGKASNEFDKSPGKSKFATSSPPSSSSH